MQDAYVINSLTSLAFLLLVAFWADRYERESSIVLVRVFFWSVLATGCFAIVKCLVLGLCRPGMAPLVVEAYVIAGAAEEALKFGILWRLLPRLRGLDEPMDPIVYLGVIALGFTFHENIGYFLHFTAEGQRVAAATGDPSLYRQQLGFIFLARAVPGHLLFNTCAAFLLARGFVAGDLRRRLLPAYLLATLLHGTWNLLAGIGSWPAFLLYAGSLIVASVAVVVWALRRSPHRRRQLELQADLERLEERDPGLPRRLIRVLRRVTGERQLELERQVRRHLGGNEARAAEEIAAVVAEESRLHGRGMRFWEFVLGILLAGFLANVAIELAGQTLLRLSCLSV